MKAQGLHRRRRLTSARTPGAIAAEARLDHLEVRCYEAGYVNGLWHWDCHHGSKKVQTPKGELVVPILFGVLDDRSRLACHLQWYLSEDAENVAHGLTQAFQKRGLPRSALSDNGGAMTAAEIREGLARLGVEEKVVRLHVEQPHLGAGQLRFLARRILGFHAARETFRRILLRRRDLVTLFAQAKRKRPRRIRVSGPLQLWGADLTLVWVLGFLPIWILGVVDYRGSRLVAFERLYWPTSTAIGRALSVAIEEHGAPKRLLSDRGAVFSAPAVEDVLAAHGTRHVLTRPAHPWTNGRIERIFRTFKETVFARFWLIASLSQLDRFCADFLQWHNRDRPHSAWNGRTPDEVLFGRPIQRCPLERVSYLDGRLAWYRFG